MTRSKPPPVVLQALGELDQTIAGLEHKNPRAEKRARNMLHRLADRADRAMLIRIIKALAKWLVGNNVDGD